MTEVPQQKGTQTSFELWDGDSGNRIGVYDSEVDALDDFRKLISDNGVEYAETIALLRIGPRGGYHRVALGPALIAMARKAAKAGHNVVTEPKSPGAPSRLLTDSKA
jgi:hypothetical protein